MRETNFQMRLAAPCALLLTFFATLFSAGCGTPGAPQPPSLRLPDPVIDLAATRTGDRISLTWTMPRKNTDKLLIKGEIAARVCRKEQTDACIAVPGDVSFPPKAAASFAEALPAELAVGPARQLTYFVELRNSKGRSAGLSNPATVLAGQAPRLVAGLSARVRKDGVVLHWTDDRNDEYQADLSTVVRLHRTLLTPLTAQHDAPQDARSKAKSTDGMLPAPREPIEQDLLVEGSAGSATNDKTLDKSIRFGATYEYRAQRVARVTIGADTVELAGPLSAPVRVEALDIFPPDVPTGLAAVAIAADSSAGPAIDLSWQPVADADLAGYAVYRREGDDQGASWQRISHDLVIGPGFHDPAVQPGHSYHYAVTAIDQKGHESSRSVEAQETVPGT